VLENHPLQAYFRLQQEEVFMHTLSVAAILAALTLPTLSADLTPSAIRSLLEEEDAGMLLEGLDDSSWAAFLGHVEAGHRGWMDLVPELAPATAGPMAVGLASALSRALTANPAGVLSVMAAANYKAGDICGPVHTDLSTRQNVRFIDAALVKVAAVLEPDLFEPRNACLFALGRARVTVLTEADFR
jgi:hypothetical protein